MGGYPGGRLRRTVRPGGLSGVHADFTAEADRVSAQVPQLRNAGERLLLAHGKKIATRQADLKRLCQAATEIYAKISTISRISDVLDEESDHTIPGDEQEG